MVFQTSQLAHEDAIALAINLVVYLNGCRYKPFFSPKWPQGPVFIQDADSTCVKKYICRAA